MLADFVALYRGRTVMDADLVAVTAESRIVRKFFAEMIGEVSDTTEPETGETPPLAVVRGDED